MNFLTRLRGLQAPIALDEPLRLQDGFSGIVTPGGGGTGQTVLIARNMRDVRRQSRPPGGLNPTGVAPATYSSANIQVGADGRIVSAANGATGTVLANVTPDTHPAIPTANDDEFESGSTIDTAGTRFAGATPWTGLNNLAATTAVAQGCCLFTSDSSSSSNPAWNMYMQPVAGTTFTYTAKFAAIKLGSGAGVLFFRNSANGHLLTSGFAISSVPITFASRAVSPTSTSTSLLSGVQVANIVNVQTFWMYLQIRYDGTNLIYNISATGVPGSFANVYSETAAAFLGAAPTHVGFGAETLSVGTPTLITLDWFRKTA